MKITHLKIENFHCFRETEFDFARQTTVFIGKNGTGKSSLIKAICNALSFIFNKSNNSWGYSSLANEVSDLGVERINVREIYHNGKIADYVSIKGVATMSASNIPHSRDDEDVMLKWDIRRNSYEKSTLQSSLYKDAYIKFRNIIGQNDRYPLLVYYSDRYPHINTNLGANAKAMLNEDEDIGRTWGYYHWNEFSSCTEIWQRRFIRISNQLMHIDRSLNETEDGGARDTLLQQKRNIVKEIEYVVGFLKSFTDSNIEGLSDRNGDFKISSISVDGATDFYIKFTFSDGIQRAWDELPAGLERLFSIVFDMAYRSYVLNRGMSVPNGIVLIDEVDLHLHPSLQQDVLLRLTKTFPEVQFIVTTHSPLVITNLRQDEDNKVVRMERNGKDYSHSAVGNLFVHDYAYTLYEIMQTSPRNFILDSLSERYIRLKRREKVKEAEEVLNQLRKLVGEADFPLLFSQLESDLRKG
ncbi:MAG: AAA family ATPase [Bacteroides sp.]|nr:AAA family ATPase [Bacteroides sp.]MBD5306321.1 AAA family ATPase [Bacteroides sp.]